MVIFPAWATCDYARLILAIFDAIIFLCLQTKKYLHKSETQYFIASITNLQEIIEK